MTPRVRRRCALGAIQGHGDQRRDADARQQRTKAGQENQVQAPDITANPMPVPISVMARKRALQKQCGEKIYRRADPATMSKRNKRHSIGPFHIGTRWLSFSRISEGSFISGLSTQAVQPA